MVPSAERRYKNSTVVSICGDFFGDTVRGCPWTSFRRSSERGERFTVLPDRMVEFDSDPELPDE